MNNKPIKTRVLEVVEYWACNIPHHRHKNEATAKDCMLKRQDTKEPLLDKERKLKADFNSIECLILFLDLNSFSDIARIKGRSPTRIKQLVCKGLRVALGKKLPLGQDYHTKKWMIENERAIRDSIEEWKLRQISLKNIVSRYE